MLRQQQLFIRTIKHLFIFEIETYVENLGCEGASPNFFYELLILLPDKMIESKEFLKQFDITAMSNHVPIF